MTKPWWQFWSSRSALEQEVAAAVQEQARKQAVLIREANTRRIQRLVDPTSQFVDPDGTIWSRMNEGDDDEARKVGDLAGARRDAREKADSNSYAKSIVKHTINYTVFTGLPHTIKQEEDVEVDSDRARAEKRAIQRAIRRMQKKKRNRWGKVQPNIARESVVDGEVFVRVTPDGAGGLDVRFLDAESVKPPKDPKPNQTWGIETEDGDVQNVLGYWVDGEFFDAAEVIHETWNTAANVKRGLSDLFCVDEALEDAVGLRKTMSTTMRVQASFAIVREHENEGAPHDLTKEFANSNADVLVDQSDHWLDSLMSRFQFDQLRIKGVRPGTIYDADGHKIRGLKDVFDASKGVDVLRAVIREISAGTNLPVFMIAGDVQQQNSASTGLITARGPAHMHFRKRQAEIGGVVKQIYEAAVDAASEFDEDLGEDWQDRWEIEVGEIEIVHEDGLREAQKYEVLHQIGAASRRGIATAFGLDYDQVLRDRAADGEDVDLDDGEVPPLPPLPQAEA